MVRSKAFPANGLTRGSAIVFAVRLVNVAVAFGLSVLLLRALGLQEFGAYATYMAMMGLAVLPMTAGLPNLLVRAAAPAFADHKLDLVRGTLGFVLGIFWRYLLLLALCLGAMWLVAPAWLSLPLLGLLWLHAQLQTLAALRSALLRAAGHVVRGQILERLVQPVLTLCFNVGAIFALGEDFSVFHAVLALLAAHAVVFVWGGLWVRRFAIGPGPQSPVDRARLWSEGLSMSGSGFLSSVMMHGLVLMISAVASLEATGLYRIAATVAQPLIYFHEVLVQVVSPRLAQHWQRSEHRALRRILHMGVLCSVGLVALGFVLLALVGRPLLGWAYGSESLAAFPILILLALSHAANASGGLTDDFLNMSGFAVLAFRTRLVLIPMAVALTLPAVLIWGPAGAACILVAYQASLAFWLGLRSRRATGIDPTFLGAIVATKRG